MTIPNAIGITRVPRIVSFLNPLMRRLLRVGLPLGPNVLLTVRGRTSGRLRTAPVALLHYQGRRYVQSVYAEVNWVRNLRAAGEAVVTRAGRQEEVIATELKPEEAGPILRDALSPFLKTPVLGAILRRYFAVGADATLEDFIAEARRRHPTFELRRKS